MSSVFYLGLLVHGQLTAAKALTTRWDRPGRAPSAGDANAAAEERAALGERQLSVPWYAEPAWLGTREELEEAWAAELSRACVAIAWA